MGTATLAFGKTHFYNEAQKRTTASPVREVSGDMSTILIGIAGGTGSGKTTLTRHLKQHFGDDVTVIGHDSYYKRQEGKTYE